MTFAFGETVISVSWIMLVTLFVMFVILMRMVGRRIGRWRIKRSADDERPVSAIEVAHIKSPSVVPTLRLSGPILSSAAGGAPIGSVTYADEFARRLAILADATAVKALIIELNTPGGSVSGSETIRTAIADFAEKKPIFLHVTDMAASGGMWILAALENAKHPDRIFASRGALLGSVGVVGPTLMEYSGITRMAGLFGNGIEAEKIDGTVLAAGRGKALGHPFASKEDRDWSKERFLALLEETRQQFVSLICRARGVAKDVFGDDGIGAGIITAEQALSYGFVDGLLSRGQLEDKVRAVLNLAPDEMVFLTISRKRGGKLKRLMESVLEPFHVLAVTNETANIQAALARERVLVLDQPHLFGL
jgi:ClpP class serine protease